MDAKQAARQVAEGSIVLLNMLKYLGRYKP